MILKETPKSKPSKIISEMKKVGLYDSKFLRELKESLAYADKINSLYSQRISHVSEKYE